MKMRIVLNQLKSLKVAKSKDENLKMVVLMVMMKVVMKVAMKVVMKVEMNVVMKVGMKLVMINNFMMSEISKCLVGFIFEVFPPQDKVKIIGGG